jgi:phage gp46-like protein
MDIRSQWRAFEADWVLDGAGALAEDGGIETAVLISLFTDAQASLAELASGTNADDRRGWWADAFAAPEGDRIGSKLWLLARAKQTPDTLERARIYAREALQWLIDDGIARDVEIEATAPRAGLLALTVTILRANSDLAATRYRFDAFWTSPTAS